MYYVLYKIYNTMIYESLMMPLSHLISINCPHGPSTRALERFLCRNNSHPILCANLHLQLPFHFTTPFASRSSIRFHLSINFIHFVIDWISGLLVCVWQRRGAVISVHHIETPTDRVQERNNNRSKQASAEAEAATIKRREGREKNKTTRVQNNISYPKYFI